MKALSKKVINACKKRLVELKAQRAETLREMTKDLVQETASDPTDQAALLQEESRNEALRQKLNSELREIDAALHRIDEDDHYGICEETGDPIEEKRLLAIPYARLSIEGAEIQESRKRQLGNDFDETGST